MTTATAWLPTSALQAGDRVLDPTDTGRALTVARVQRGSLVHYDGSWSLRVFFGYPYDAEQRECHPTYAWQLAGTATRA